MNLASVKSGDVVRCDVRGDRFWGLVTDKRPGEVAVESATGRPIPAMTITARQVVGHWRQAKGSAV